MATVGCPRLSPQSLSHSRPMITGHGRTRHSAFLFTCTQGQEWPWPCSAWRDHRAGCGTNFGGYIVDNYSWPWIFFITCRWACWADYGVNFVREPEDIRAPAGHGRQSAGPIGLGRHALSASGGGFQYVLRKESRTTGSTHRSFWTHLSRSVALASFIVRRMTAVLLRWTSRPVQGQRVSPRDSGGRGDVRTAHW